MSIVPKAIVLGSALGAVGAVMTYSVMVPPAASTMTSAQSLALAPVPVPTKTVKLPCTPPATLVGDVCVRAVLGPVETVVVPPVQVAHPQSVIPAAAAGTPTAASPTTTSGTGTGEPGDGEHDGGDD